MRRVPNVSAGSTSLYFSMAIMNICGSHSTVSLIINAYRRAANLSIHFSCIKRSKRFVHNLPCSYYTPKKAYIFSYLFCRKYYSVILNPPYSIVGCSVHHHGDSGTTYTISKQQANENKFLSDLCYAHSCTQVFKLLSSLEVFTDTMAAAALLKVAQVETKDGILTNPRKVFDNMIFKAICLQFEQESKNLSTAGIVNALKAFVQLRVDPWSNLMVRLLSESQERAEKGEMNIQYLCMLGRCLLEIEGPECAMLKPVMDQVLQKKINDWTPEEIAMVYGLLQAGLGEKGQYQGLLNQMHEATVSKASQMNPTLISSILTALVDLKQTQALPLVINLCKNSIRCMPHFTDEELVNVIVALTNFGHSDKYFTEALERHVPRMVFTMSPELVSRVMEYCSKRLILSKPIFDAVAESFVYNSENCTTLQIAQQIIPFGELNYLPPNAASMFRRLEKILSSRFSQFQPQILLKLLHSCILLERFPVNFVAKIFSPYFIQQLQDNAVGGHSDRYTSKDQSGNVDKFVLALLTQLFLTVSLECPFYEGPRLLPKYRVKSFSASGQSLETMVDVHLYNRVKSGLIDLLGARMYFASHVLSPYCYTLDVEIKLDEEGFVLAASSHEEVHRRIALCIDGQKRFCSNTHKLLGKESIKQRHLRLLGYEVIQVFFIFQIPFYEFDNLSYKEEIVEYLHKKIFPHTYRLNW
ncbi:FAST kinase domain-containing protein 3, mitochondrial isoform X1 [Xenopus tropicalis]|uniref:FAST kinase domain-containing protein 3, mitochondrial isoform X1 n=2 Tax=Xenopus tropicalis TaxID=8364 RepID=A0A803JXS1_XENTR|nr:FAST kinase domain-containing protein 3, mitochondrial isoform X1 [Xenopus tropicalis]|eukprot:XP_012819835.1 PREDICTED: FAST kinase domain-containing protein 3, mitochondrial isoform X1 [Xenopus tropicalis]